MSIIQNNKKSLIVKDKKIEKIIMPTKFLNQKNFLEQLIKWETYQFNLFFRLIDKICYTINFSTEKWNNFKNSDLKVEIPTNLIFSKSQIKNYVYRIENFEQTKQKLQDLTNLSFSIEKIINGLPKIIIYKIFPTLEFDFKHKEKISFWINKKLINKIDNFLDSFKKFNTKDLTNYNLSKIETRFRILLCSLRILQNDKQHFNKKLLILPIERLYKILNVPQKKEFRIFNRDILKPLIKKINETEYFKNENLQIKNLTDKTKVKIIAVKFIIPNFVFDKEQPEIETKQQEKKDIDKKIKDLVIDIMGEN